MKLCTTIFPSLYMRDDYYRMLEVLKVSAAQNSPSTPLEIYQIPHLDAEIIAIGEKRRWAYTRNAVKTKHHAEIVQRARNGELLGLLDCDLMILSDLSEVAQHDFDLAITERSGGQFQWNTGVVFVRISERIKRWFCGWYSVALDMLRDSDFHAQYRGANSERKGFGGINQSALAHLLIHGDGQVKMKYLPCRTWNAVKEDWPHVNHETKAVHILTDLQKACLGVGPVRGSLRPLVERWRNFEREAVAA